MSVIVQSVVSFSRRHPISRGMLAYSILWPSSNMVQQMIQKRPEGIDWKEMGRFSLFGCTYVAPTIYIWVRFIGKVLPGTSLKIAVTKALVEQVIYSPIAISGFYLGLGLLEGKSWGQAKEELLEKFIPTYKTGLCVWPLVQTLNFAFIKERNRVPVTGTVSFFWTIFLSYMKHLELKRVV